MEKDKLKNILFNELNKTRYDKGKGYFFVIDKKGTMILDPSKPQINGKNVYNMQDKKGNYPFKDMIRIANTQNAGFVKYWWTKPGSGVSPKLTYISNIPGTDLIIGTGVYIDDVAAQVALLKSYHTTSNKLYDSSCHYSCNSYNYCCSLGYISY